MYNIIRVAVSGRSVGGCCYCAWLSEQIVFQCNEISQLCQCSGQENFLGNNGIMCRVAMHFLKSNNLPKTHFVFKYFSMK